MLGFMAISGIFGLRNLQGFEVLLQLPDEIYRNIPVQATLQITARRHKPNFLLGFHLEDATAVLPFIPAGKSVSLGLPVCFGRRGSSTCQRLAVTSPFPVNFFVRSTIIPVNTPYKVFPEPLPISGPAANRSETSNGTVASRTPGGSSDLESLAGYTGREPLKLVHWKLSARHDDLLVKELQKEQELPVTINPDELPGTLEERLSRAVFLINSLMASGRAVGLILANEELQPATGRNHRLAMLGRLADHVPA